LEDRHAIGGVELRGGLLREIFGRVFAVIVNQDDGEFTGVILSEERSDGGGDGFGFVAGRDDRGDFWPCG